LLKNGHVPHYLELRCERNGEAMVVRLAGELDIAAEEYFERSLRSLEDDGGGGIVLDLSGLSFMDSTGIRLILQAWDSARRDGSGFAVLLGDSPVKRTLEIAGLDRVLPIAADAKHSAVAGKS
jgi:anti-sigma B factor antagonist